MKKKGRPKGGKNRTWNQEEKYRIISRVLTGENSALQIAKDENISDGMLANWIKKYQEGGKQSLINKRKTGNPFAKYQNRKHLTRLEQLEFDNLKLRLENELLKKGLVLEEVIDLQTK